MVDKWFRSSSGRRHREDLERSDLFMRVPPSPQQKNGPRRITARRATYVCKHLFRQPSPRGLIKCRIEANNPATALQAVARHLQLVHRMDVLCVHPYAGPVGTLDCPHIQIFVPSRLQKQGVVAIVQVGEFTEHMEFAFGIKFRL